MLASDGDILAAMRRGHLQISPTEPGLIQPASIDLRLDHRFRAYDRSLAPQTEPIIDGDRRLIRAETEPWILDPATEPAEDPMIETEVPEGGSFVLPSHGFALASTLEFVSVSQHIAAALEGKSSLGRLGLLVHATAGWIDPGFLGHVTLELFNAAPRPIRLWPGMKIGQLAVMTLDTPARRPYGTAGLGSHYQGQGRGPQPSQAWRNFRTWPTRQQEFSRA